MQNKLSRFLFYLLLFLILFQLFSRNQNNQQNGTEDVLITTKDKMVIGKEVAVTIQNRSQNTLTINTECPSNPLLVEYYQNGEWIEQAASANQEKCEASAQKWTTIEPGNQVVIGFGLWNKDLFDEIGRYRLSYQTTIDDKERSYSTEINITKPGLIRRTWNELLYKPIFNTLVFFIQSIPGNNLGWAIILLTLLIKLILLVPNQKALKAQKQLQRIQPQLDALKQKHKDNPQLLAAETMEIWKKNKVNPMGSCLPMLIQFPILIALFYVVKDGLTVLDPNLLYGNLKSFELEIIDPVFLGLIDLTKINFIALPLIVAGLQFFQISLSLGKVKTSAATNPAMPMMNKMMKFFLPAMIAVFTASLPAAVGFYWGTSTLFAIGQQIVVNKSKE